MIPDSAPFRRFITSPWLWATVMAFMAVVIRLVVEHQRPMHTDEAVNAVRLATLLTTGQFVYDPVDHHGPSLFWVAWPVMRLLGIHDLASMETWHLRLVPALLSGALLLTIPAWCRWLPTHAVLWAGAWWMLSAPLVYTGTDFIHEPLMVLVIMLGMLSALRWCEVRTWPWAAATGIALGVLIATKETVLITGLAALVAIVAWRVTCPVSWPLLTRRSIVIVALSTAIIALLVAIAFFTALGTAPSEALKIHLGWWHALARTGAEGHVSPWDQYLRWLCVPNLRAWPWCGWLLLGWGGIGTIVVWRQRRDHPVRWFLALFTITTAAIYSAIPYKTPWLMLNVLVPAALIAGVGCHVTLSLITERWRTAAFALLSVAMLIALGWETKRLAWRFPTDPGNPLAYAQTVPDCMELAAFVNKIHTDQPGVIQVIGADAWPLPWYLRRLPQVGYWPTMPTAAPGPVVIAMPDQHIAVAERLGPGWRSRWFGLRPEVLAVVFTREPR